MTFSVKSYFFDLGFYPSKQDDFHLGTKDHKQFILRTVWEMGVYGLLTLGILCREVLHFHPLRLDSSDINYPMVAAALVVAAIPFPIIMRKMTKLKSKGGLMHVVVPFAYGITFNYMAHLVLKTS